MPDAVTFEIVWAGRFMELKHPEYMIRLAADLVRAGFRFHIHMIGDGELKNRMEEYAEAELVAEYITMYGYKSPEEVRDIMENCDIMGASIVDMSKTHMIIQMCDTPERTALFIKMLTGVSIIEVARTGCLALQKCSEE